jgi:hypothetical protein
MKRTEEQPELEARAWNSNQLEAHDQEPTLTKRVLYL